MTWSSFALASIAAPDAMAGTQWLTPGTISEPGLQNSRARVAFSGQNEVITVWTRAQCTFVATMKTCSNQRVQAAIKPPGQPFSAPQTIAGDPGAAIREDARVGADAQGRAVAVWTSLENGSEKVRYALRAPGQPFGPAQTMGNLTDAFSASPALAVDPLGNMVAVWNSTPNGSDYTIRYAIGTTATGFGPSQPMPPDATSDLGSAPDVAFDGLGNIIAVWIKRDGSSLGRIQVANGNLGGFAPAEPIQEDMGVSDARPVLATGARGDAVVLAESTAGMVSQVLKYAIKPAGLPFGELEAFDDNPGVSNTGAVAVAPGGRAIAVWGYFNGVSDRGVRYAIREPGGGFAPAKQMSDPGTEGGFTRVRFDGNGNALAVWASFDGSLKVRTSSAPAGAEFGGTVTLPGPDAGGTSPDLAIDPQGNAVAVWQGNIVGMPTDVDVPVLAAGYDAAGPLLRDLSLPARGDTSKPTPFSVNPVDVWSPVSTRFSFGDGQATTAAVSAPHRYRSAGRFNVSVTATDAIGNSSTATGSVQIADKTRPVISRLKMTRRTFAVGPKSTAKRAAKRRKPGSAFRFRLSERANVTIRIARVLPGRRVGKRCRKPTGKLLRRPRCKRYVNVGTLTRRNRRAGSNVVAFSGRIGKRALKRGAYRATLSAVDRAKNRSKAKRITFRIA